MRFDSYVSLFDEHLAIEVSSFISGINDFDSNSIEEKLEYFEYFLPCDDCFNIRTMLMLVFENRNYIDQNTLSYISSEIYEYLTKKYFIMIISSPFLMNHQKKEKMLKIL